MQACVPGMVDLLVGLTEDDYDLVASFSRTALENLSQQLSNGKGQAINFACKSLLKRGYKIGLSTSHGMEEVFLGNIVFF